MKTRKNTIALTAALLAVTLGAPAASAGTITAGALVTETMMEIQSFNNLVLYAAYGVDESTTLHFNTNVDAASQTFSFSSAAGSSYLGRPVNISGSGFFNSALDLFSTYGGSRGDIGVAGLARSVHSGQLDGCNVAAANHLHLPLLFQPHDFRQQFVAGFHVPLALFASGGGSPVARLRVLPAERVELLLQFRELIHHRLFGGQQLEGVVQAQPTTPLRKLMKRCGCAAAPGPEQRPAPRSRS